MLFKVIPEKDFWVSGHQIQLGWWLGFDGCTIFEDLGMRWDESGNVGLSVSPDWNITTTSEWITIKFSQRLNSTDFSELTLHYPHLKTVVNKIPEIDPDAEILRLLGRDILCAHKVREQYNELHVCLGAAHKSTSISVYKTNILQNGRASLLSPCKSSIQVKERLSCHTPNLSPQNSMHHLERESDDLGSQVFQRTQHDDKPLCQLKMRSSWRRWSNKCIRTVQTRGLPPYLFGHHRTVFQITDLKP